MRRFLNSFLCTAVFGASAVFLATSSQAENVLVPPGIFGPFIPTYENNHLTGDSDFGGDTDVLLEITIERRADGRGVDANLLYELTEPRPDNTALSFVKVFPIWEAPEGRRILRLSNSAADLFYRRTLTAPGAGVELGACHPGEKIRLSAAGGSNVIRNVSIIADTGGGDIYGGGLHDHSGCDSQVSSISIRGVLAWLDEEPLSERSAEILAEKARLAEKVKAEEEAKLAEIEKQKQAEIEKQKQVEIDKIKESKG